MRGGTIALMIWVNHTWDPTLLDGTAFEAVHRQNFHVPWNDPLQGATAADLVFPLFLFAAGASIPLSMKFGRGQDRPWWRTMMTALWRGVVLYLLGVLLTVASAAYTRPLVWGDLLSWNILQLIAGAYVVSVGLFLLPRKVQIGLVAAILVAKWGVMTLVPYEAVAELGAGQAAEGSPTGTGTWQHFHGVKTWINGHLGWFGGFQQALPAAAIAMAGGWTSLFLASDTRIGRKIGLSLLAGVGAIGVALLLSAGYDASGGGWLGRLTVPSSKWFFSVPYCALSAGVGMVSLLVLWLVCDWRRLTTLMPLRVFGLNAIVLYVGSEMLFKTIIARWTITSPNGDVASIAGGIIAWTTHVSGSSVVGGLLWPTLWLVVWWFVLFWMHRRKLYIRV